MGAKERVQSVEGKALMTSFFAAQMLDTTMTKIEFEYLGGKEINPLGSEIMNSYGEDNAFILKTALVTILLTTYALAHDHDTKIGVASRELDVKYTMERGLQWGSVLAWGGVVWNSANIIPDVVSKVT